MNRFLLALVVFLAAVRPAAADRVFSSGFELGIAGDGYEWRTGGPCTSPPPGQIQRCYVLPQVRSSNARTGMKAGYIRANSRPDPFETLIPRFYLPVPAQAEYFARCNFRFETFPTGETTFLQLLPGRVTIDGTGFLRLYDGVNAVTGSTMLTTGTYHRIELRVYTGGAPGSDEVRLRLDGNDDAAIVAADYGSTPINLWEIGKNLGALEEVDSGSWYVDDCGLNNTLGTNNNGETSWLGDGSILHLFPNGEGDQDSSGQSLSEAGSSLGCTDTTRAQCLALVDDSQTYVGLDRATSFVDVAVDDLPLPANTQVQFVAVGIRFTCESTSACNHVVGVKSRSNGNVATATTTIVLPSPNIWWSHSDDAGQQLYRLVQYRDPQDLTLRWSDSTLDSMQLRVATTDGNPDTNVSTVWALVEYEPQSDLTVTLGSD